MLETDSTEGTPQARIKPVVCEIKIEADCEYIIRLPNGDNASMIFTEEDGPMLAVEMWRMNSRRTYLEAVANRQFKLAEDLR